MTSTLGQDASGITITRATAADAAQLARTAAALFEQAFGDANTPEDMTAYVGDAFSEARQGREIEDPRSRIWLARADDGTLVGYAHVRLDVSPSARAPHRRAAEIARLYADRRWHGRGLGAALMHACIDSARQESADLLWLGVWERNARAIAFYGKHGFRVIGHQEFLLGSDRQRDLVMAQDLTANDR
jgi:ribosomal protein S18 acetylase RimI-like enzyme